MNERLLRVLPSKQSKDLFNQLAGMAINVVGEAEVKRSGEDAPLGNATGREAAFNERPEAPATLASLPDGRWEFYSDVPEG